MAAGLAAGGLNVPTSRGAESASARHALREHVLERVKEKLGLTDEQIEKIKAELKADKDTLKSEVTQLHQARVGLRAAIQAADATETSVRAAAAKVAAAEADFAVERFKLYGKINPILTAEQRRIQPRTHRRVEGDCDVAGVEPFVRVCVRPCTEGPAQFPDSLAQVAA